MAIRRIVSAIRAVGVSREDPNKERLEPRSPILESPSGFGSAEEHVLDIAPDDMPGVVLKLALEIIPRQDSHAIAPPRPAKRNEVDVPRVGRPMTATDAPQWDLFQEKARERILAYVEEFLHLVPGWGEITLLKAAGMDSRFIYRLRKQGEGFRSSSVDALIEAMNKAARGELKPGDVRDTAERRGETRTKAASSRQTRAKEPSRGNRGTRAKQQ